MQLTIWKLFLLLAAVGLPATVGTILYSGSVSPHDWVYQGGNPFSTSDYRDGGIHAAPGPIVGAGLPGLVGYGMYWLVKRRRRKPD